MEHKHHGHCKEESGNSCCPCHNHEHHHEESPKKKIIKIVVATILLISAYIVEKKTALSTWQLLLIYLIPYLIVGFETLKEAFEGVAHGDMFNEHFLMSIATIGALCIGFLPGAETQFPEAVFVMLFFQVGELFEGYAEGRSRDSISRLMEIRPDTATVMRGGVEIVVSPEQVFVGETIVVRPGERIPLDGRVVEGESSLDTSALTGESVPRDVAPGDEVLSGCVNVSGVIKIETSKTYSEGTVTKILEMVENANGRKSKSEAFITRFARVYTPVVVVCAVLLAVVPPLFSGSFLSSFSTWLYRALMFLVVSCPCALVISVPLSFFGGIGGASRKGILVKGANYIDALSNIGTVVFDKTGTLTRGVFTVESVHPESIAEEQLLHLAAHVEHFSTHPIGAALRNAFPDEATDGCEISEIEEIAGQGICATVQGRRVAVGNSKLMDTVGVKWHDCHLSGTVVHVAVDGEYAGHVIINDTVKEDSEEAVQRLEELGVGKVVMLTGDRRKTAEDIARKLGVKEVHCELLPADKVAIVESLSGEHSGCLAFVGDGINDAPVLARADVGIAMGGLGSDAAIEAADVVIMDDKPSKVADAVSIARRTVSIARQNVVFAIAVKLAVLLLAALGIAEMWSAVFADVGVTVIAVLNAMRTLNVK